MTDKLYARKRIHLQKIKFKKISFLKLFVLFLIIFIFVVIILFFYSAYPILKASCETAAGSKATNIANQEVIKIMQDYSYNDLINIEKDNKGKVILMEANIVPINRVVSTIVSNIQKRIDDSPRTTVYINMGAITGITGLKNIGPRFDIELETAGKIDANVRTEFDSVGINQTLHKIYLDLNTSIGILTPFTNFSRNIKSSVLLTQAVIVGDVPSTYYDFNEKSTTEEETAIEAIN